MNIAALSPVHQNLLVQGKAIEKENIHGPGFKDMLADAIRNVTALEKESESLTNDFIAGKTDSIHSVLIAAEKASLSLDMIIEVRNKVLDAYNEIMRMQV